MNLNPNSTRSAMDISVRTRNAWEARWKELEPWVMVAGRAPASMKEKHTKILSSLGAMGVPMKAVRRLSLDNPFDPDTMNRLKQYLENRRKYASRRGNRSQSAARGK